VTPKNPKHAFAGYPINEEVIVEPWPNLLPS
jgi:hypothetical protein